MMVAKPLAVSVVLDPKWLECRGAAAVFWPLHFCDPGDPPPNRADLTAPKKYAMRMSRSIYCDACGVLREREAFGTPELRHRGSS